MKLWVDDVRPAPEGYIWCQSVNNAKTIIENMEKEQSDLREKAFHYLANYNKKAYFDTMNSIQSKEIDLIDIDHDAGEYAQYGGDYIKLLDWLEETGRNYPIRIHSMNPVGVANMRAIIQRNGWREIR